MEIIAKNKKLALLLLLLFLTVSGTTTAIIMNSDDSSSAEEDPINEPDEKPEEDEKPDVPGVEGEFVVKTLTDTTVEVELDLGITEEDEEGFEVVISEINTPTNTETIDYDATTKTVLFDELSTEEGYKISLNAPEGYKNDVKDITVTTLRTTFELSGTLTGTNVSHNGFTVNTSILNDSHIVDQNVRVVVTNDSNSIVAEQDYIKGQSDYSFTGLTDNRTFTVSIAIDDEEFLMNKVSDITVTTERLVKILSGSLETQGVAGNQTQIKIDTSSIDKSVIDGQLVEIIVDYTGTAISDSENYSQELILGQDEYVFNVVGKEERGNKLKEYNVSITIDDETYLTNQITQIISMVQGPAYFAVNAHGSFVSMSDITKNSFTIDDFPLMANRHANGISVRFHVTEVGAGQDDIANSVAHFDITVESGVFAETSTVYQKITIEGLNPGTEYIVNTYEILDLRGLDINSTEDFTSFGIWLTDVKVTTLP